MSVLSPIGLSAPVRRAVPSLRRLSRTTPGVIVLIALAVAVACVIAGIVCATDLNRRNTAHDSVLERSEPFAYAAQNLYAALSEADAAAASAFLSGGIQTPAMRERYRQAVATSAAALTDVTAGATDSAIRTAVAEISAELATYTGLVEAARANNVQGFPVGSAYLREASALMQTAMLPGAEEILAHDLASVEDGRRDIGSAAWAGIALLVVVLVVVAAGSWILARRTNRQYNAGLLVAATLVLLTIAWIVAATQLAAAELEASRVEGTARFEQLAKARILAQRARTDETLQLIARGDITSSENTFQTHLDQLVREVAAGPTAAADAIDRWSASHQKHVDAYLSGDYPAAVAQAIGSRPDGSAAHFAVVEASLRDEIESTRAVLRERIAAAGRYLAWSPVGTLALLALASAAAIVGLWPRLKEFL